MCIGYFGIGILVRPTRQALHSTVHTHFFYLRRYLPKLCYTTRLQSWCCHLFQHKNNSICVRATGCKASLFAIYLLSNYVLHTTILSQSSGKKRQPKSSPQAITSISSPLFSSKASAAHLHHKLCLVKTVQYYVSFFSWIFSIAVTSPNIKSVNTYLLLRLPEKWTSFSLSPLPLILLFLIISILFSAELSSHLKALFDLLSEQYKMWNQDSRSLFSSNSSTALIVHRRFSSPS